jgi:hypothetical protein
MEHWAAEIRYPANQPRWKVQLAFLEAKCDACFPFLSKLPSLDIFEKKVRKYSLFDRDAAVADSGLFG